MQISQAAALAAIALVMTGCPRVCTTDFNCGDQSYCDLSTNVCRTDCYDPNDCLHPIGCEDRDEGCAPIGSICRDGRCAGLVPAPSEKLIGLEDDGWDAPPGSGISFVVDAIEIGDADVGFNLDQRCNPTCIDNILSTLGQHANQSIQQGVTASSTLLVIEIAGLIEAYDGRDDAVTVKVYEVEDADDDLTNNFGGAGTYRISPVALTIDGQAKTRALASIRRKTLQVTEPFDLDLTLSLAQTVRPTISFNDMRIALVVEPSLNRIEEGVLGGALKAGALHAIENPYCRQPGPLCASLFPDSSLLDLVAIVVARPDIDVDRDGGECMMDTDGDQRIDLCCNGVRASDSCLSGVCNAEPVMSLGPNPSDCALHPNMADGYSVGFSLSGVRATLLR